MTEQQQRLLTNAREAIRSQPESYNQMQYGTGVPDCGSPGCIAGHVVAGDRELSDELNEQLKAEGQGREDGRESLKEARENLKDRAAGAIQRIASRVLRTEHRPWLFRSSWPIEWRQKADLPHNPRLPSDAGFFCPTWREAIQVLDGILDGRIDDAFDAGWGGWTPARTTSQATQSQS